MNKPKRRNSFNVDFELRNAPISLIVSDVDGESFDKKELRNRAAYFLLNGAPEFSVNEENGKLKLLAADKDFYAYKGTGATEVQVRIYHFTENNAETFSCIEKLKAENLETMEEAYLMQRLVKEFALTQDDVAALIGRSRPAVANTLRLLTLEPEVIGLIESGKLSAGHARTLLPLKDKEVLLKLAEDIVLKGISVREAERIVKALLNPKKEKSSAKKAKRDPWYDECELAIKAELGRKAEIHVAKGNRGTIEIEFFSKEDLHGLLEALVR